MVEPLTEAWIEAMDAAASTHDGLLAATTHMALVIEYRVVDGETWHVRLEGGTVRVVHGPADEPDLAFTAGSTAAAAIADGTLDPLRAVIDGDVILAGDPRVLVDHRAVLDGLGDVFAPARHSQDQA